MSESATRPSYTFDAERNPSALEPIVGAQVVLELSKDYDDHRHVRYTDVNGHWDRLASNVFGEVSGGPGPTVTITVNEAGFDPFKYQIVGYQTHDPVHREKFMNIVLSRAGTSPAAGNDDADAGAP